MLVHLGKGASQPLVARQWGSGSVRAHAGSRPRFVRLVVVESGSTGLTARAPIDDGLPLVVVAQGDDEWAASFAHRVVRRILATEMAEQSIERTVLFLGARSDPETAQARLTIARALITHACASLGRSPELILDASGESCESLQYEMRAEVDDLICSAVVDALRVAIKLAHRSR